MKQKDIIIFFADEINPAGIDLLDKKGFKTVKVYGLKNKELINFISKFRPLKQNRKCSALVIRTIRDLNKNDLVLINRVTDVKLVCTASSGFDNIDLKAAAKLGIDVMHVPDATYIAAAEHTFAMLLALTKNIIPANSDMKKGIFDFKRYSNSELYGKTIGIIGVGRVGSLVAKIAKTFGMTILGNDIKVNLAKKYKWIKFISKEKLMSESDVITVHTPLDDSTKDIINTANIKRIKKNAILLNCARGGIINEAALIKAIKTQRVKYAGIDVFSKEPGFNKAFSKLNNIILTPHLAGKTAESKLRVSKQLAERIIKYYSIRTGRISVN